MIAGIPVCEALMLSTLPLALHHRGEPTAWTRMTRPGQHLHSFLEGPAFDADGALLLADVPHGRILRMAWDGAWTEALNYDGEPHGIVVEESGTLLLTDYRRGVLRADLTTGTITSVADGYAGEPFRGLSDIAVDVDGTIWFTDSGRSSLSDPCGRLFRLTNGRLECVLDRIPYPNGLAFSSDGAFVYLAVTRANAVWRLARRWPEGTRPMAGVYIQLSGGLGPDGLAVARDGRLAVAHAQAGRVWLFSPVGDPIACIRTPSGAWTTAVHFGGVDDSELFIIEAQSGSVLSWHPDWSKS